MKRPILLLLLMLGLAPGLRFVAWAAHPWDKAEELHAKGAYALARDAYLQLQTNGLPRADVRWILFRRADSAWRAAISGPDGQSVDAAQAALSALAPLDAVPAERDAVWREVRESLGDLGSRRGEARDQVIAHYTAALEAWAGSTDLDTARTRYLSLIWKWHSPAHFGRGFQGFSQEMPLQVLDNAVSIARTPADVARAHRVRAQAAIASGNSERMRLQVEQDLEAALAAGKSVSDFDETLFQHAGWLETSGRFRGMPDGQWVREPDAPRALAVYQRFLREFKQGESAYWEAARDRVKDITSVSLGLSVQGVFLPGSEVQFQANWRNTKSIRFSITPIDLTRDVRFADPGIGINAWQQAIRVEGVKPVQEWTLDTGDTGEHQAADRAIVVSPKLPAGAYLLEAKTGSTTAREVLLVTDLTVVVQSVGARTVAWVVDAITGRPQPGAQVREWVHFQPGNGTAGRWESRDRVADAEGIAEWVSETGQWGEQWISARAGARQAFVGGWTSGDARNPDQWKVHAFTDRPAYRPGDVVNWKLTVRHQQNGELVTPGGRILWYELLDSRGSAFTNGTVTLNAFGSAWGTFSPGSTAILGQYQIRFCDANAKGKFIGTAVLFRLEEYKLPEFEVRVEPPTETTAGGVVKPKSFRPGERIPVTLRAEYYFGGPVADAEVEVRIRQSPFGWNHPVENEYPWLSPVDADAATDGGGGGMARMGRRWMGQGQTPPQEVKRETVRTDAQGRVVVWVDSDAAQGDVELRVEARVTDASRREVTGRGVVRATRSAYSVAVKPSIRVPRPGDTVRLGFRSVDPNGQPIAVTGTLKISRETWWEVWLDSLGNEIEGPALKRAREKSPVWPPRPAPGMREWRLKSSGYKREELGSRQVALNESGRAETVFQPEREGFYRFIWEGPDRADPQLPQWKPVVRAETLVWVSTRTTTDLSYSHNGLELIPSVETARPGESLPVLVVGPESDRWVLLSVVADHLVERRVVHLVGTVARIEIPITDAMSPNLWIHGVLVNDRAMHSDQKDIAVPPLKHVLAVEVKPEMNPAAPRAETPFTVVTRDAAGRPVSAEVALSVFDESVLQIQSEFAEDPRRLFLGGHRPEQMRGASTLNERPYLRFIRTRNGSILDDRDRVELDGAGNPVKNAAVPLDSLEVPVLAQRYGLAGGSAPKNLTPIPSNFSVATELARFGLMRKGGERRVVTGTLNRSAAASMVMDSAAAGGGGAADEGGDAVVVRTDFRATAFWQSDVRTGSDGTARVTVHYPESLTRWQVVARAVTTGSEFGQARAETRTVQPLVARLELPRFLVVGDTAVVSALIHNHASNTVNAAIRLEATGVHPLATEFGTPRRITLAPGAEARLDWTVSAAAAGRAAFRLTANGGSVSDGVEKSIEVHAHGLLQEFTRAGKAASGDVTVRLPLPERAPGSSRMEVRVTPSLALTLLDALPYLADYPYGCTEQTMSRFLPAVMVRQTLKTTGLDAEAAMQRTFGGISTNRNGAVSPSLGARKDLTRLGLMTQSGLERLADFQHDDGSWGWWKEGGSDAWMTAYVAWGMKRASRAGIQGVEADRLRRADDWMLAHLVEFKSNPALQLWMLQALVEPLSIDGKLSLQRRPSLDQALENVWAQRKELSSYSRALLVGVLHHLGDRARAADVILTLSNGVIRDEKPDVSVLISGGGAGAPPTVHWGRDQDWYRWEDGAVETTSAVIRALLLEDPKNALIEPAVNWLLKNRRGAQWSNTRDTALAILALNDYLETTGELKNRLEFSVEVNGHAVGRHSVTPETMLQAPMSWSVNPAWLGDTNEIRIVRLSGNAPIYFNVSAGCFTVTEPVAAAGNEVFIRRDYFRLVPEPTLLSGVKERRERLADGTKIDSGDRLETVVTVEAKVDLEYVLLEDLKPAGIEAEELRSGGGIELGELQRTKIEARLASSGPPGDFLERTGRTSWAHPEWRDRTVSVFVHRLPEGLWELRYRFRATTPGTYHALPVVAQAMYVPEIRGNSSEWRVEVRDRKSGTAHP